MSSALVSPRRGGAGRDGDFGAHSPPSNISTPPHPSGHYRTRTSQSLHKHSAQDLYRVVNRQPQLSASWNEESLLALDGVYEEVLGIDSAPVALRELPALIPTEPSPDSALASTTGQGHASLTLYPGGHSASETGGDALHDASSSGGNGETTALHVVVQQCVDVLWDQVVPLLRPLLERLAAETPQACLESTLRLEYQSNPSASLNGYERGQVISFEDSFSDDEAPDKPPGPASAADIIRAFAEHRRANLRHGIPGASAVQLPSNELVLPRLTEEPPSR